MHLIWSEPESGSTGNLSSYQIWKNGLLLDEVLPLWPEYLDDEVEFDSTYNYVVVAVYDDGCEAESEPLSVTVIWDAVQENATDISIYPNPAKDILHIEGKDILQVEVFNVVGQKVLSIHENFDAIQLNSLPDGMYFVRLQTKQGEKMAKLIIEK